MAVMGVAVNDRFPGALKLAMTAYGLTGYRLAKQTGIPQPAVSRLLAGKRKPTADIIRCLSSVFDFRHIEGLQQARALDLLDAEDIFLAENLWMDSRSLGPNQGPISIVHSIPDKTARLAIYKDISCGWTGSKMDGIASSGAFSETMIEGADHAVIVHDTSMVEVGFRPGTHLFVKCQATAANGQPVIARIDGADYICKIYRDTGRKQWLEGRNDAIKDRLYVDQHEIEIMGVVVAWWGSAVNPAPTHRAEKSLAETSLVVVTAEEEQMTAQEKQERAESSTSRN
jgi:SOS-response transcriptional repressor LexA